MYIIDLLKKQVLYMLGTYYNALFTGMLAPVTHMQGMILLGLTLWVWWKVCLLRKK